MSADSDLKMRLKYKQKVKKSQTYFKLSKLPKLHSQMWICKLFLFIITVITVSHFSDCYETAFHCNFDIINKVISKCN